MKTNFTPWILIFSFAFLLLRSEQSYAQLVEFAPIHQQKFLTLTENYPTAKIQGKNTLPFWDDFSGGIDSLKWSVAGASYSETIPQNAPSLGTVLFNGVDANGKPYSLQIRDQGESDFLTSKPFDLSTISPTEKETLFLSFFWQAGGKSEAPDQNDRLTLQVFNREGIWTTVWFKSGGSTLDRTRFTQEIIRILPEWQHADFKFRFLSTGRQVGPFDSWLLDYVYLNSNRRATDISYRDRALTQPNQLKLGEFTAYPFELIQRNRSADWSQVKNEFLNLENRFRAMEYSIQIEDSLGRVIQSINTNTPFNPVPNALERRSFLSREIEEIPLPSGPSDLVIRSSLTSGDGFLFEIASGDTLEYQSVDFRVNDTVKSTFPLRDFLAYDNGSADYAAGINQRGGQIAIQFSAPEPLFVKGISINFTNASQVNQAIDIVVWDQLDKKPIYSKASLIPAKLPGQNFVYYSLDTNLRVTDEFYIGFTQFSNDFIHVGLDKVNDQADKIFYNVGGGWVQNKEVLGSLLLRPHVSLAAPFEQSALPESQFRIYPNPVVSQLFVEGSFTDLTVFDSFGRQILLPRVRRDEGEIVNFEGQRPGIYVVNLFSESGPKSFRILVSK